MRPGILALTVLLSACAHQAKHYDAPSTVGISTSATKAQSGVAAARTHTQALSRGNAEARTLSQRMHDKDMLIDRWLETHSPDDAP
jgi:hypothetical protein